MASKNKLFRYNTMLFMVGALCSISCGEKSEPGKNLEKTNLENGRGEYFNHDRNSSESTGEAQLDTTPHFVAEADDESFDSSLVGGTPGEYTCDMRYAPMCRQTMIMPPQTKCSELDDIDCDVYGKIVGKICRLFGQHDCRQITKCSDLTALGQKKCHGERLGRLFAYPKTKFCAWDNRECKRVATLSPQTECSTLSDSACAIPNKIPGVACRLFAANKCRPVGNCEDLTPLGEEHCKDNIGSGHCGWVENACVSYYH